MAISGYCSSGIESEAIGWQLYRQYQCEWWRGKIQEQQEEDLDAGQDGRGIGGQPHIHFVAEAQTRIRSR